MKDSMYYCSLCNSKVTVSRALTNHFDFPSRYKLRVFVTYCERCSSYQLNPMPTQADYLDIYCGNYFTSESDSFYEESRDDRNRVYAAKVDRIKSIAPEAITLLDIGAGEGDFIKIALSKFQCCAIEYSDYGYQLVSKMDNVTAVRGTAMDILKFDRKFDVIVMHHVFEHLVDPVQFLFIVAKCMHADSILVIEVPNQFESIVFKLRNWVNRPEMYTGLFSLHHPFIYTKRGIAKLLKNHGFSIRRITTSPQERKICSTDTKFKAILRKYMLFPVQALFEVGSVIEVVCSLEKSSSDYDVNLPH